MPVQTNYTEYLMFGIDIAQLNTWQMLYLQIIQHLLCKNSISKYLERKRIEYE